MKLLTNKQITEIYKDGYDTKGKMDELWFHAVCMYINVNLIELERNTWDRDRIKRLKEYLDLKEKTFGEFTTGGDRIDLLKEIMEKINETRLLLRQN